MGTMIIENLPFEMIVEILSYLDLTDLKEARLVCKNWYESIFHPRLIDKMTLSLNNSNYNEYNTFIRKRYFYGIKFSNINFNENDEDIRLYKPFGFLCFEKCTITIKQFITILKMTQNLKTLDVKQCDFGIYLDAISELSCVGNNLKNVRNFHFENLVIDNTSLYNILIKMMPNLDFQEVDWYNDERCDVIYNNLELKSKTLNKIRVSSFSPPEFIENLAKTPKLKLKEFNFKCDMTQALLKILIDHQQSITELYLSTCTENIYLITICNKMPNLKALHITFTASLEDEAIKDLWKLRNLKALEMNSSSQISGNAFIRGLKDKNDNLQSLTLSIQENGVNLLNHISKNFPNLTELHFISNSAIMEYEFQSLWKNLHRLRKFSLECASMTLTDFFFTGKLTEEQNKENEVSEAQTNHEQIFGYSITCATALKYLGLYTNGNISESSLNEIVKLKELVTLYLPLNNSKIEMDNLKIFGKCKKLEYLTIKLQSVVVDKSKTTRKMLKSHFRPRLKYFHINKVRY